MYKISQHAKVTALLTALDQIQQFSKQCLHLNSQDHQDTLGMEPKARLDNVPDWTPLMTAMVAVGQ